MSARPRTLDAVLAEIERLQAEADALRNRERDAVIQQCATAIRSYSITMAELKRAMCSAPSSASGTTIVPRPAKGAASKPGSTARGRLMSATVRYTDGKGNGWSGYGRQPGWVREYLFKRGHKLEQLLSPDFDPEAFKVALREARIADEKQRVGGAV